MCACDRWRGTSFDHKNIGASMSMGSILGRREARNMTRHVHNILGRPLAQRREHAMHMSSRARGLEPRARAVQPRSGAGPGSPPRNGAAKAKKGKSPYMYVCTRTYGRLSVFEGNLIRGILKY